MHPTMYSQCVPRSEMLREAYSPAPLFLSTLLLIFSQTPNLQLHKTVHYPMMVPCMFESCFCASAHTVSSSWKALPIFKMILAVKERIPAQISLCERRDLLVHITIQCIEPASENTIMIIKGLSGNPPLSFSLSPIPPSPEVSPTIGKLPSCTE